MDIQIHTALITKGVVDLINKHHDASFETPENRIKEASSIVIALGASLQMILEGVGPRFRAKLLGELVTGILGGFDKG